MSTEKHKEAVRMIVRHLIDRRHAMKLSQVALAGKVGINKSTLERIEMGKFSPNLETLLKLCEGLDLYFFVSPKEANNNFTEIMKARWGAHNPN